VGYTITAASGRRFYLQEKTRHMAGVWLEKSTRVDFHPPSPTGWCKGESDRNGGAYMAKIVIVLAIIGIAYWYWTGPYQNSANTTAVDDPKQNAEIMGRCIAREKHMEAAAGLAGLADVGSTGKDAEKVCADENSLSKVDGEWHRR
jgi:hypothetical protein